MLTALMLTFLAAAPVGQDCNCVAVLDTVAEAVERNYAGYQVKLPDKHDRQIHAQYLALMRADARGLEPAACRRHINRYLDFFNDEHLFVSAPALEPTSPEETKRAPVVPGGRAVSIEAPEIPTLAARWTPDKVEFRLRREANLDPVEGLWKDDEGQFAIVYDDAIPRGEYVAFRFERKYRIRPGEVFAFVRPAGDGTYAVVFKAGEDDWREARATLTADGVLTFADKGWQRTTDPATQTGEQPDRFAEREEPENSGDAATPAGDPLAPQFRDLGDGLYYLKLASFMPKYREPLNALIEEHGDTLSKARGLVIDVRGNGGGDAIYYPLADWFLTGPITVSKPSAVLASQWNVEYFRRLRERLGENGDWLEPVLERMQANPGDIVPYRDGTIEGPDNPRPGPEEIVVLQDRGVGSAAEAFLLHARQSPKVVTMGEPSRGNIDYQQVTIRTLACGDYSVDFGWPLYMRSRDLPLDSLDDSGVAPDVLLTQGEDWLAFATRWLRESTTRN